MDIHGTLFDGQSARGQEAVLRLTGDSLVITPADGAALRWPVKQVELAELPPPGAPVRLRCRTMPGAVFSVTDAEGVAALTGLLPHLLDRSRRHRKRWTFTIVAAGISALVVAGVYFGWPQMARQIAYRIPAEWETRLGESSMAQLETFIGQPCANVKDRPALNVLDALADRLAEGRELPQTIKVHVVDWSYKNAFALPGGHVVFTTGIIEFMEGPGELAGVLAHEMGHVERRHVMISLVQNWGLNLLLSVAFGGGGGASDVSYLLLSSAYSRDLEREADDIGLDLLAHAGISSVGFARLFERFKEEGKKKESSGSLRLPDFIRTHPATESRIARARAAVGAGRPAMTAAEWSSVKSVCGGD